MRREKKRKDGTTERRKDSNPRCWSLILPRTLGAVEDNARLAVEAQLVLCLGTRSSQGRQSRRATGSCLDAELAQPLLFAVGLDVPDQNADNNTDKQNGPDGEKNRAANHPAHD